MKNKTSLRHNLRLKVLERIMRGDLHPGTKINESRLAKELKVSRTPVRETLLTLGQEGFIRADKGRGFYLEPISANEVREIYPIIGALEELALRASQKFVSMIIHKLLYINHNLSKAKTANNALSLDARWHQILISNCRNRKLLSMHGTLRLGIRRYERLYMKEPELVKISISQHNAIIKALKNGKIEAAIKALNENWQFTMESLVLRLLELS